MIEKKFRGKLSHGGEWIYGYFIEHEHHAGIIPLDSFKFVDNGEALDFYYEWVDRKTVGQFTGQKNIYDGDGGVHPVFGAYHVAFGEYNHNWKQEIGFYINWKIEYHRSRLRKDLGFWIDDGLLFDMNIHDNSELLEVQK